MAATAPEVVVVDGRFNGPPGSANGGYACGVLGARVDAPAAEVTLRLPVPLDVPLAVEPQDGGHLALRHGAGLIAEARPIDLVDVAPPVRPTFAQAQAASTRYPGHVPAAHPLPPCFV
ncbi:MAG: hypothetical protein HZB46_18700, partial [Solirubrobacterales bacterium]|nr:hypothetical protein [Solirubrobacterales bacterium]